MLSSTLNQGKSAASWNTTLRRGSGRRTGSPRNSTSPRVGPSNPATMFRSVDLPQPDGPRTAANSLGPIRRSMPWRATSRPDRRPPGHRSEEHTSELQSQFHLVCRLLLEKKKKKKKKKTRKSHRKKQRDA